MFVKTHNRSKSAKNGFCGLQFDRLITRYEQLMSVEIMNEIGWKMRPLSCTFNEHINTELNEPKNVSRHDSG